MPDFALPRSRILGTGHYLPDVVRTNFDLEKMVDTTDEWIRERTGILERHIAPEGMASSDMAKIAAERALTAAGILPEDLDMIIVGTVTGDMPMPATAVFLQQKLGAPHCPSFDISAACAGFVFGLSIADQFIRSAAMNNVLVVGVELLSRVLNWKDRTTCVLFGDGAGAAVVGPSGNLRTENDKPRGILSTRLHTDGSLAHSLKIPAGGSLSPLTHELVEQQKNKVEMRGQDIFKVAVKNLYSASKNAVDAAGMTPDEVDWICPHQANIRIIDQAVQRLHVDRNKVLVNIDRVGNTSSASIPILLDENVRSGKIKSGQTVLMCALGAGISWGSALVRM
jgi:3-oxoacyl-[acyl-carrier-protein] synthase-3